MSYNLRLGTETCAFDLEQTPSNVTEAALAPGADPLAVYLRWADRSRGVAYRCTCEARLRAYLAAHPSAEWYGR